MTKQTLAVFPGTFDPFTLGHHDIVQRSANIFDKVLIAVANSPAKHTLMTLADRVTAIQQVYAGQEQITVMGFSGMLVDFLKEQKADILVRGVRTVADYDYEVQLAGMYRALMPEMEIVLLPTSGHLSYISSTLVREVIIHHGDISKFVLPPIAQMVARNYQQVRV
ncbi:MAG: pantetheine-phosphate adenylyltransferase [Succinivibrio sp.]|nr:pantetheine-phosphate adenylyltransferase [Succinivibrio sp.]